jgi:hypothetical protein
MDEDDVGVAAPPGLQRLAGALRDHPHLDAGRRLEHRQDVVEQARLLGRGGRGHRDERFLLRRWGTAMGNAATTRFPTAFSCASCKRIPSPQQLARTETPARPRFAAARRTPRPAVLDEPAVMRNSTSSASRRAWPRSWVVITIFTPSP